MVLVIGDESIKKKIQNETSGTLFLVIQIKSMLGLILIPEMQSISCGSIRLLQLSNFWSKKSKIRLS
jgi:hypothetical protein